MKKQREKLKKQIEEHKVVYGILFLSLLVFTVGFLYNRYDPDSYYLEAYGYRNNAFYPFFQDGRWFMTFFLGIMGLLDIPFSVCKIIAWLFSFLSLYISILLFYHILDSIKKNKKFANALLSFLMVINIFVVEFFMFPECVVFMCVGILVISFSTYFLIHYFKTKDRKYLFFSCLYSFLSAFFYQGILSFLVLFPIIFTLYYAKNIKTFIYHNLSIALIYFIPSCTTLVVTHFTGSSRSPSSFHFIESFKKIVHGFWHMISSTFSILPPYFFIILFIVFTGCIIYSLFYEKQKLNKFLFYIYVMVAVIVVTLLPQVLIDYHHVWIVPRSNASLGLFIVFPLVYYYIYIKPKDCIVKTFGVCIGFLLFFQLFGWYHLLFDQVKSNVLAEREAFDITSKILEYEKKNDRITKIAIYPSDNPVYQYSGIQAQGDMNVRVFSAEWAADDVISLYLNRSLSVVEKMEKWEKKCRKIQKQEKDIVLFDKDTAIVCTY